VTSVTGKAPAVAIAGDKKAKGALTMTVRNDSGVAFNGPVTVAALASTDGVADTADVAVAQSTKGLKLKVGQSKAVKLKLALSSLPPGSYQLIGVATAGDLSSSVAGPSLSVQAPFVHLVGTGAPAAPGKPITPGKKAVLSIPLRNDGNVPTTRTPATYTILLSADGTEATAVYQATVTGKINLKPGAARPQKVGLTFPVGAFPNGTYAMLVKVNAELNDTNGQVIAALPPAVL
jgi:hypothetical protein